MAASIGPKIGIDGEKEYREAIQGLIQQGKTLDAEMRAVAAGFDASTASEEDAAKQTDLLNQRIETQREYVARLADMVNESTEKTGENSSQTLKWREALANAETQLSALEGTADESGAEVEDLGAEMADAGSSAIHLGDLIKANLISEAIIGGVKALAGMAKQLSEAFVDLGKEVVSSFAELEQNIGGSEAVFGGFAEEVQRSAEIAYKTLGASESEYLATANKMGALFQGSGLSVERSMELTTAAMRRAADAASVMGIDTEAALEAVSGAAKGNYTMMDNLGVAMNATTLEAYAASQGIKTLWKDMDNAQKAEVAMAYFFERTEQYAGNFERESRQTISGSLGMLTASVESWVAGLGNSQSDIVLLTQNVIDSFLSVVDNVTPVMESLAESLPKAITGALPAIQETLPEIVTAAAGLIDSLLPELTSLLPVLVPVAVDAVLTIVEGLTQPSSLNNLVRAGIVLTTSIVQGLARMLPQLLQSGGQMVGELIAGLTQLIPDLIDMAPELVMAVVEGLKAAWPSIKAAGGEIVSQFGDGLSDWWAAVRGWGQDMIDNFIDGILAGARALWGVVTDIAGGIRDLIGFSEPDKGPLSDFHTFGPDMMKLYAKTIADNAWRVQDAVGALALEVDASLSGIEPALAPTAGGRSVDLGGIVVNIYDREDRDDEDLVDELMYRLQLAVSRKLGVFA